MGGSGPTELAPAWRQKRPPRARDGGETEVAHAVEARAASATGSAAAMALEAVARQLRPPTATFFSVGADDEIDRTIVHRPGPPERAVELVAGWKRALLHVDPLRPRALAAMRGGIATFDDLGGIEAVVAGSPWAAAAYRRIAVVNDVRMLVRAGDRVVGGVTLWRPIDSERWDPEQLATLAALQPLIERAYVATLQEEGADDPLPATLTDREREVAQLIAHGATNAEVARALQIAKETAKSHARAILMKVGARSRRDVAMRLRRPPQPPQLPAEDAATASRLLGALVRWAQLRVDGTAGGYAVVSGRGEVVHGETALAGPAVRPVASAAREIHEALCAPVFVRRLLTVGNAWDVLATAAGHPRGERIAVLGRAVGWSSPLVLVVRSRGRVAGLIWVARDAASPVSERDAFAELRAMRPLVEAAIGPLLRRALARPPQPAGIARKGLTAREWEVARASSSGASNAEIARALGISEGTVKAHMTRVLVKCGVRSRTQLIALMRQW